jgi:hypothetical protein
MLFISLIFPLDFENEINFSKKIENFVSNSWQMGINIVCLVIGSGNFEK